MLSLVDDRKEENMNGLKITSWVTLGLGIISFVWLGLAFAALTDIWHGIESDLSAEWWIVSRGFVPLALFHLSAFVTLILTINYFKKTRPGFNQIGE
jgi:hypothetical protein